ncbi:RNA-directed DNA polymerase from mobile element jockey [Exaiptasia diaphana]|nr:RNA-directed DNA polymerase from mobile element jockey [Exaiptasia diaphana]
MELSENKAFIQPIVHFLERNNKLPTSVGGARPKRSTTSNVEALLHIMQEGLQNMNCYAIGLFDLEDAYNRVHIPTLADKMIGFGISEVMTRWVLSMLDERRCHMRFGNWRSDAFKVSSGLPQGSPLSCVLFNIYTADIISWTKDEETDPFSYVDDIIISCVSESPVKAVEQLQIASDRLESWTVENRMRIQPDKVCWMLVTLRHVDRNQLSLRYAQEKVRQEKEVTYLGVVIDSRLSMLGHIANNINKAKKALGVIRYAAGQNIQLKSLVTLVRATIVSRLEYGLHLCCPISKTQFSKMDKVLNQSLRIISGAAQKTSGEALQFYLGFHSMEYYYKMRAGKELVRALTCVSHPLNALLREHRQVSVSWSTRKQGRTSSFRAESEGFEDALVWISKYGTYNDTIVLLTDSKSLVVRLKSGLVKESWVSLLDNLKSTLFITYIPGHAGITYNEAADHLAGQAKPIGHINLNTKDVSSRLREVLSDGEERKTWWSLSRLKDLGFSFGDGANCATRKTATKITTQHIMGLLTKNTLRVILRRGWPGRFIP